METPAWILVIFLSVALLIFLVVTTILCIKLIELTKDIRNVVMKGQDIADDVEGITRNVRNMTNVSGIIKTVLETFNIRVGEKKGKK